MSKDKLDTRSADYVLSELAHIHKQQQNIANSVIQRVNLHIAITSGTVALIVFFSQSTVFGRLGLLFVSLVLAGVLMLGLLIYAEMVVWVVTTINLDRLDNRAKSYFYHRDPSLTKYFGQPFDDRPLHIKRKRLVDILQTNLGSKQIVTVLNNWIGGVMIACVVLTINPLGYWLAFTLGIATFIIVWFIQFLYSRLRYRLCEEAYESEIRFPRPEKIDTNSSIPSVQNQD